MGEKVQVQSGDDLFRDHQFFMGPVVCSCLSPRRRVFLFKLPWILDVLLVSISRFYCYIMASRNGPVAAGTDGSDFGHRERVANQYRISALSKSRLKICFFFHFLLFFLLLAKLSADIFDRLDIFILEIEELEIPKPLVWEYAWCCSLLFVFYGLSSLRKNVIKSMSIFFVGNIVFALMPVIFSLGYHFNEFWAGKHTFCGRIINVAGISHCHSVVWFFTGCISSALFFTLLCTYFDICLEGPRK